MSLVVGWQDARAKDMQKINIGSRMYVLCASDDFYGACLGHYHRYHVPAYSCSGEFNPS